MKIQTRVLFVLISFALIANVIGCAQKTSTQTAVAPSPSPSPRPIKLTAADLQKLRWIEGTWRGTGVNQPAFFERYRFENETTRFELKDGEFGGGSEGSRYVASALDDNSITFDPAVKARNSFIWRRETKDTWTAIIKPLATPDKPAKEIIYNMERWPKE